MNLKKQNGFAPSFFPTTVLSGWRFLRRRGAILCFLILFLFAACYYEGFLQPRNLANLLQNASILGIVALGMNFVIITGGIDLSVGSVLALSGVAAALLMPYGLVWGVLGGLAVGAATGLINGFCITRLRLEPFIATMAMLIGARGMCYLLTDSMPVSLDNDTPGIFLALGQSKILGALPVSGTIFVVFTIVCMFVLHKTAWGRNLFAIGNNPQAARLYGINTNRVQLVSYLVCGLLAAFAGLIYAARLGVGQPTGGEGYEMEAVLAVVMGGTLITGGVGSASGTFFGVLILTLLDNILNLQGNVDNAVRNCIIGAIFLIVIVAQQGMLRKRRKKDVQEG